MKNTLSPFHGDPKTRQIIDENGEIKFIIKAKHITPEGFFIGTLLAKMTILPLIMFVIYTAYTEGYEFKIWGTLYAALILYFYYIIFKDLWLWIFTKKKTVEITKDFIVVKGFFEDTIFSRDWPHRFSIIPHDKTQQENDKFDISRAKKRKRLYSASYHLSFDYAGHRNDLITVYGHKNAMAIANRLTACCEAASNSSAPANETPLSSAWKSDLAEDID